MRHLTITYFGQTFRYKKFNFLLFIRMFKFGNLSEKLFFCYFFIQSINDKSK